MRSLSIASLILLAFVLGLALGGQVPREAVAQDEQPGIEWKKVGDNLVLTNWTQDSAFLALGAYKDGATAPAPPLHADGILKIPVVALDEAYVYQLVPVWECDPIECRLCDEEGSICPIPPRPPLGPKEIMTVIGQIP